VNDDKKGILVMAVKDFGLDKDSVDPGSTVEKCETCGQDVYCASSSKRIRELDPETELICCCCADIHDRDTFMKEMFKPGVHFHEFRGGLCDCGTTEAEWMQLDVEIRDNLELIKDARAKLGIE
jgi:hypothetical protein